MARRPKAKMTEKETHTRLEPGRHVLIFHCDRDTWQKTALGTQFSLMTTPPGQQIAVEQRFIDVSTSAEVFVCDVKDADPGTPFGCISFVHPEPPQ